MALLYQPMKWTFHFQQNQSKSFKLIETFTYRSSQTQIETEIVPVHVKSHLYFKKKTLLAMSKVTPITPQIKSQITQIELRITK